MLSGLETARVLAGKGAHVFIGSRSLKNGEEAIEKIKKDFPEADVKCIQLDLGSLKSVKAFADQFLATGQPLNVLINNAGIMAPPRELTSDGIESQFGVNHIGHFYLTKLLLPALERSATPEYPSRVVNLSSIAQYLFAPAEGIKFEDINAEKEYGHYDRYGHSKLANVLFTKGLNEREQGKNVISVSVHPGVIGSTGLAGQTFQSLGAMVSIVKDAKTLTGLRYLAGDNKNIPQGSSTSVFAALSPDVVPGAHYADCKEETTCLHSKASDKELIEKLWNFSEDLVASKVGQ